MQEETIRAAWAMAWLREYRGQSRYQSLLRSEEAGDTELRFAWLEWWNAACACREASKRLDCAQLYRWTP
jgi:hypothetical protein